MKKNLNLKDNVNLEKQIRKDYWEKELSGGVIADKLGCSSQMVYKLMKMYNIPTRSLSEARHLAIKKGRVDCSEVIRKSQATLHQWVMEGKYKWKRPSKYAEKIYLLEAKENKPFAAILNDLYWENQLSIRDIAQYLNNVMAQIPGRPFKVNKSYVSRKMKLFGIPTREISEATKLGMQRLPQEIKASFGKRKKLN